jgi:uncharacterized protein (DUF169 family)
VVFSPLNQLLFEPGVVIITENVSQAQPILRVLSYSSGEMRLCKGTTVAACSCKPIPSFAKILTAMCHLLT